MSGCGCKSDSIESNEIGTVETGNLFMDTLKMVTKILIFIIASVIGSIVVIPFTIYLLFKTIFGNGSVDVNKLALSIIKQNKKTNEEDIDDEKELDSDDEYELVDVDDITNEMKN
jgi:hypothetical protein